MILRFYSNISPFSCIFTIPISKIGGNFSSSFITACKGTRSICYKTKWVSTEPLPFYLTLFFCFLFRFYSAESTPAKCEAVYILKQGEAYLFLCLPSCLMDTEEKGFQDLQILFTMDRRRFFFLWLYVFRAVYWCGRCLFLELCWS